MKIFVTGATGFIGKYIIPLLVSEGHHVVICARRPPRDLPPEVSFYEADLLGKEGTQEVLARERPSHLIHLAWGMQPARSYWSCPGNLDWLFATQRLVQQFYSTGGRRFLGVGTCVEYSPVMSPRDEMLTPTSPDTLYGKSKLACCNFTAAFAQGSGLSTLWCRPFYMLGPGEASHRLIPSAYRALQKNEPFQPQSGNHRLDYLDVRDVARAIVELLFSPLAGVINIASGKAVPINTLLQGLGQILKREHLIIPAAQTGNSFFIEATTTRLQAEASFIPTYDLAHSLSDCIAYLQQHPGEHNEL